MEIIPGILATTEGEYKELVESLNAAVALKDGWVQLDIMDNRFVDNKSIGVDVIKKYPLNFNVEAQLMVEFPENWIDELIKLEVSRIVFPIEDNAGVEERIRHIRNHNIQVGLSINPSTHLGKISPWLESVDCVLMMSVNPGFGGQEFIQATLERVREIRKRSKDVTIEVDGGITTQIVPLLQEVGADAVVIGAKRLIEEGIDETLEEIWQAVQETQIK